MILWCRSVPKIADPVFPLSRLPHRSNRKTPAMSKAGLRHTLFIFHQIMVFPDVLQVHMRILSVACFHGDSIPSLAVAAAAAAHRLQ
jgi:hypothetical protein